MTDAPSECHLPSWWNRLESWRVTVPVAALGWMWLMVAGWKQEPALGPTVAVLIAAWSLALLWRASETKVPKLRVVLALSAGLVSFALALLWLPRGLLFQALGLATLGGMPCFIVNSGNRWVFQIGVSLAGMLALVLLWVAPFPWSVNTRLVLMILLVWGVVQLVRTRDAFSSLALPLASLRGLVFAAAVLAPSSWYAPGGLPSELLRKENALFAVVCVAAAVLAQADRRQLTGAGPTGIRLLVLSFLSMIIVAAFLLAVSVQHHALRPAFLSIGLTALALLSAVVCRTRSPRAASVIQETALLAPWCVLPLVPTLING